MQLSRKVTVLGGGPAGASAALAALEAGSDVRIYEPARVPRHKVCGEFFTPEILPLLERMGVLEAFLEAAPGRPRELRVHLPKRTIRCRLSEPAYALSRYRFDQILFERARTAGAEHISKRGTVDEAAGEGAVVLAHGRREMQPRGRRLFGFKAHFEGPSDDAIELFFFRGGYVGINTVEGGRTNVCGLAREEVLRGSVWLDGEADVLHPALRDRLAPLRRCTEWLSSGPVRMRRWGGGEVVEGVFPAGDALGFVDPFTGTGIAAAVLTGSMAGTSAGRRGSTREYIRDCRRALGQAYLAAAMIRAAVEWKHVDEIARLAPAALLFRLTRPR